MKKFVLFLSVVLMVQPSRAQLLNDFPDAAAPAADASFAPLLVFTNGPGSIYAYEIADDARSPVQSGQMVLVESRFLLEAVPDRGCEFEGWNPVNVYTLTSTMIDTSGGVEVTNTIVSTEISPLPQIVDGHALVGEIEPLTVLFTSTYTNFNGIVITNNELTLGKGWRANFAPREK